MDVALVSLIIAIVIIPFLFCAHFICAHSKRIGQLELDNKIAQESIKALHERIYYMSKKQ